jgi:hypothetical protein
MVKVRQKYSDFSIEDPAECLRVQLLAMDPPSLPDFAANASGSPQAAADCRITRADEGHVRSAKGMGSAALRFSAWEAMRGATGKGQKAHLAQFGVSENTLEFPYCPPWMWSRWKRLTTDPRLPR